MNNTPISAESLLKEAEEMFQNDLIRIQNPFAEGVKELADRYRAWKKNVDEILSSPVEQAPATKFKFIDAMDIRAKQYGYKNHQDFMDNPEEEHDDWSFHLKLFEEAAEIYRNAK